MSYPGDAPARPSTATTGYSCRQICVYMSRRICAMCIPPDARCPSPTKPPPIATNLFSQTLARAAQSLQTPEASPSTAANLPATPAANFPSRHSGPLALRLSRTVGRLRLDFDKGPWAILSLQYSTYSLEVERLTGLAKGPPAITAPGPHSTAPHHTAPLLPPPDQRSICTPSD